MHFPQRVFFFHNRTTTNIYVNRYFGVIFCGTYNFFSVSQHYDFILFVLNNVLGPSRLE